MKHGITSTDPMISERESHFGGKMLVFLGLPVEGVKIPIGGGEGLICDPYWWWRGPMLIR